MSSTHSLYHLRIMSPLRTTISMTGVPASVLSLRKGVSTNCSESEKYANACSMPVDRGIVRSFISMTHLIHSWRCGEGVFSGAGWVVELVSSSSS